MYCNSHKTIVYVVNRTGLLVKKHNSDQALFDYVKLVRKKCKKPIAQGFGINSYEQVSALKDKVDIIVAGSYFVRYISELSTQQFSPQDYTRKLQIHAQNLMGWNKET
ncbi:tryptophan synthase subunit alpha [Campylobacter sp. MIT 21-1685]|uniref:tryptophan synthase subunit alpha n=1 Tax=unclassified Campylobacter TaxID=2593542 RepID=UPI00224B5B8C|nr:MULTISPECIES: tryptophan synthase subunit alpha [unclassified Campylobacter]MCX2682952.1 tryptophan synthase subunit alpha [Campylobacter sp. MIT 21-1684]MCX2751234.1 tryptophan synthase subunit alpha [Campylobacter sp. MIT 21-1682]MCX2807433.1 tryptophan synthase subunit alpha [Campylobacter sp. MIT 21-1685]